MTELAGASAENDALDRMAQAEEALRSLQEQLDRTQRLATLGTLAAGIAHEINNILTPVLAYAQLARANPQDTELVTKALERTISGVQSASRITEAVLGFARDGEGEQRANVQKAIDAALACLGRDPTRDGIALRISVEQESAVRISPLALQQVLLNLILNALNVLQRQEGELRISVSCRRDGTTEIVVADNGPGIPPEVVSTLFEPFVSVCRRPKKEGAFPSLGGSGLGLAVCKRLIENAEGTIDVSSKPGQGATFTIILPTIVSQSESKSEGSRQKSSRSRTKKEKANI